MKYFFRVLGVLAIVCLVILALVGESIRGFSAVLYFLMFVVMTVGCISILVQSRRESDESIAKAAVAQYKKDNGIAE